MINKKIRTHCPNCDSSYRIELRHIGRAVKCKRCEKAFKIAETQPVGSDHTPKLASDDQIRERPSPVDSDCKPSSPVNHMNPGIECPHCKQSVAINASFSETGDHLVTCTHCNKEFQAIHMPDPNNNDTPLTCACPFCGSEGPDNAVKCISCGKFTKNAKVTVIKIKNDHAKECLIEKLHSIAKFQDQKLDALLNNLPHSFQIDYPTAIDLEITLRNKGVILSVDDGNILTGRKKKANDNAAGSTHENGFQSKFKFETVLNDMRKKSSIFKTIIGILFSQRKDLLIISLIVIIPFFSLGLEEEKQIIFFPIFLGVLWAYIILSFYGDGNVPLFIVFKSFLFSSTLAVFMVYLLGYFADFFNFMPKLPKLFLDVGIIEEICKIIPIFLLIRKAESKPLTIRYLDVFVISMICGIGFGTCENILYKVYIDNLIQLSAIYKPPLIAGLSNSHLLRLISLPFLHACFSGVLGVIIFHGYHQKQLKAYLLWGIITIGGLHTLYDYFIEDKTLGIALVLISILLINVTFILCCYIDKMKMRIFKESFVTAR